MSFNLSYPFSIHDHDMLKNKKISKMRDDKAKQWLEDNWATVIRDYNDGLTCKDLSVMYDIKRSVIANFLKDNDLYDDTEEVINE